MERIWFKMFKYKAFFLTFLFSINSLGSDRAIKQYEKELKKFRKLQCTSSDSRKFWNLTKETNRGGYYVPTMEDGSLDIYTIQKNAAKSEREKQWIQKKY